MVLKNKLIKKYVSNSPVVECTPVIWNGRLVISEVWHTYFDSLEIARTEGDEHYIRIRDEDTGEILAKCMYGYAYSSAFVYKGVFYVFGAKRTINSNGIPESRGVYMSSSNDLINWTEVKLLIDGEEGELLWNQSVCYDGKRFVMAYETDSYVKFTIKFAVSDDLVNWDKVDGAIFGPDRYVACPAIRYCGGYYYMLYAEYLRPKWWFETYIARSKNLLNWEVAPKNPVIAPNSAQPVHPNCVKHPSVRSEWNQKIWLSKGDDDFAMQEQCPAKGMECNTSDPDLVEFDGKTRVYFTGGCQHSCGLLQYADFDGTMQQFFESYF
jgi:alpha-L-fucosidase